MSELPRLDGYDVVELIDSGGFSRVYRAIQRRFERAVAVKVLNAGFADDRQQRAFERECRVMGQLSSHPNIVTVYDSALAEYAGGHQLPAIVMELYTGTYRHVGRLGVAEVIDVGMKVADALDHIHRQGIVHRDLKPHNLFVSQHGEPAIADFGISTMGGEHTSGTRFTLKYAPPELLREGIADAAGDVYSLGVTLYQLATGHVPFDGADEAEIVRQVMVADPPPLGRSDAPGGLERILQRCLAKQPGNRPASAGEVADAFRRLQAEVGPPHRRTAATATPGTALGERTVGRDPAYQPGAVRAGQAARPTPARPAADTPDRDDALDRTAARDPAAAAPVAPDSDAAPSRRRGALIAVAGALVLAGAAAAIALTSGGDSASPATTIAPARTAPVFEVLTPPDELTVTATADGFEFTWVPDGKIRIHRVGSDDNVIADGQPFVWSLTPSDGADCFAARTINADETRMSQTATSPVCAG